MRQSQATEGVASVVAVQGADLSTEAAPGLPGLGPAFTDVAESLGIRAVRVDQDFEYMTLWLRLNVRYRLTKRTTLVRQLPLLQSEHRCGLGYRA